jgi:hypothetical protein
MKTKEKNTLIALTGRARAGKDHIATILGLQTLSIANPLYEICSYFLGSCNKDIAEHRRFLQLLGAWGRGESTPGPDNLPTRREVGKKVRHYPKEVAPVTYEETKRIVNWKEFGKNSHFWLDITTARVKHIIKGAKKEGKHVKLAIPNVRFTNELKAFQKLGFLHLHVTCSEKTLMKRRGAGHNKENDTDITEVLAKRLDTKMRGEQVIWNDENYHSPTNYGYTDSKNVLPLVSKLQ